MQLKTMDNAYWETILAVRDVVNKALEDARNTGLIGSGLEAEVVLDCNEKLYEQLSKLGDELRFVLITSKADIHRNSSKAETNTHGYGMCRFSLQNRPNANVVGTDAKMSIKTKIILVFVKDVLPI